MRAPSPPRWVARPPERRRVLRALVAVGVFAQLEDGQFSLSEAAA